MIKSFNANNDEEIKIKQDKVLKLLMKKFQEQLKSKTNLEEGILKVKFKNNPYIKHKNMDFICNSNII